ncbi:polyprenyl synthetase family protein [Corynebacterium alimapuense]|nr:polyprenyl synthetase family protein [Corynebacterium alimapuense]
MSSEVKRRVAVSLSLLEEFLAASGDPVPGNPRLLELAREGVATSALGGKHLRSALVHISAGEVTGQQLSAATAFGACVDLLHGSFLIHDDIIDRDDTRRGVPTIHALVRDEYGDPHLGTSIAITAGDLGLNRAVQLLLDSSLDDAMLRSGLRILTSAVEETITGEILDVAHSDGNVPDLELVRLSNHLKTSDYSFGAPLKLGALAAGRDPAPMQPIAFELGRAFQAADDIAGSVGDSSATGKSTGGDIVHGRMTLMTMRLEDRSGADSAAVAGAVGDVVEEGQNHLNLARVLIDESDLDLGIRAGLHDMTNRIEGMLHAHS